MSETSTVPPSVSDQVPASPPARRNQLPTWLNLRLAFGLLLVLISVLLGARVVAAADQRVQVWGVTSSLSGGTTLTTGDLAPVKVRLADASRYVRTSTSPSGRTLNRDVGRGELLPAGALGATPQGSLVSLPVSVSHAPSALTHGDRIAVFATTSRTSGGTGRTTEVLSGVTVQDVRRPTSGLAGSGGDQLAVVVRIPADQAATVVAALNDATLDVTILLGDTDGGTGATAGPTGGGTPSPTASTVPSASATP